MNTTFTRLLPLAAFLALLLPHTALACGKKKSKQVMPDVLSYEATSTTQPSETYLRLWYRGTGDHCKTISRHWSPPEHAGVRCEAQDIQRVVVAVPSTLAHTTTGWFGPDSPGILDVVPETTPLRVLVYNPSTGALLSRSAEIRGSDREAFLERQLSVASNIDIQATPRSPRALLDRITATLTSQRLVDEQTAVVLVGDWSDFDLEVSDSGDASSRMLRALPSAHYTFVNPFAPMCRKGTGSLPGQMKAHADSVAFMACGVRENALSSLIFERLFFEIVEPGSKADAHASKRCHMKKKRRCNRRGTFKRMLIVFWYSIGFFALLYLLLRRRGSGKSSDGDDDA